MEISETSIALGLGFSGSLQRLAGALVDAPGRAASLALIGPKGPVAVVDVVLLERGGGKRRILVRECRRKGCVEGVVSGGRSDRARCASVHGLAAPADPPWTLVQAAGPGHAGEQVFVVNSPALLARERRARQRSIERTRAALETLARRVAERGIDGSERIRKAAARILARNDGHRYFGWRGKGSAFVYFERPSPHDESALQGAYVIRAPEPGSSALAFVSALAFLLDRAFVRARPGLPLPVLAAGALEELEGFDVVEDKPV